jgi:glycosyltransferase involved in cell wall biosynthesis
MHIVVLHREFPHHANHSGYRQLLRALPAVEYLASWSPRALPPRLTHAIVRRAGRLAYTPKSMGFELAAVRRMFSRPRAIYHVLYAEDDYHWLAGVAPVLRRAGGRLVASFHQPPAIFDAVVGARCAGRILPRLDAAIVTTAEQAGHLARWMPAERIYHVPHGVDTDFFAPAERRPRGDGRFTVITVGTWQRDFPLLERVARQLATRNGAGMRFIVVAPPATAERFGTLPGVEAHSGVSDEKLRALYRESDALFLPVVEAAANNTLLEAMACGLPVIATDLPGIREYVGNCGARLVTRSDPDAAVTAIAALARDRAVLPELGTRARERALDLDMCEAANRLAEVYRLVRLP